MKNYICVDPDAAFNSQASIFKAFGVLVNSKTSIFCVQGSRQFEGVLDVLSMRYVEL